MVSSPQNNKSLTFTPITLQLMPRIEEIRAASGCTLYVYTFASLFSWQSYVRYEICFGDNAFLVRNASFGENAYLFPCGSQEGKENLLDALLKLEDPVFYAVTDADKRFLEEAYPGKFVFEDCRDEYAYIYDKDAQIRMAGKEYKHLRHQVNLGRAAANTWEIERLSDANMERAVALNRQWAEEHGVGDVADMVAAEAALRNFSKLSMWGLLFLADGRDVAYVAGCFITPEIFDISFCKVLDKRCDCFIKWALTAPCPPRLKQWILKTTWGLSGSESISFFASRRI